MKRDWIIIHCAATRLGHDDHVGAEQIRAWHLDRGWRDIGYNFVIRRDGTIEQGRSLAVAGAHTGDVLRERGKRSWNQRGIGVCLVGGLDGDGRNTLTDPYTPAQWTTLSELVRRLMREHAVPKANIAGHRDMQKRFGQSPGKSRKACPCFNAAAWARAGCPPAGPDQWPATSD